MKKGRAGKGRESSNTNPTKEDANSSSFVKDCFVRAFQPNVEVEQANDLDQRLLELMNKEDELAQKNFEEQMLNILDLCRRLQDPRIRTRIPSWMKEKVDKSKFNEVSLKWHYYTSVKMIDALLSRIIDYNTCRQCKTYLSTTSLANIRNIKDPKLLTSYDAKVARLCVIINDYSQRIKSTNQNASDLVVTDNPQRLLQMYQIIQLYLSARNLSDLTDGLCGPLCSIQVEARYKFDNFDYDF